LEAAARARGSARERAGREVEQASAARSLADELAEQARERLRAAEGEIQDTRREAARVGGELAVANPVSAQPRDRRGTRVPTHPDGAPKALSEQLSVRDGYELALAAALGGRLSATLVKDVAGAEALLDRAGPDGAVALLVERGSHASLPARREGEPPKAGAERLLDLVSGPAQVMELAGRLLADAWVSSALEDLPVAFAGIAATRTGECGSRRGARCAS